MPAANSIESKLLNGLALRKMPTAEFVILARMRGIKISTTKFNEAMRDVDALRNDTALELSALLQEVEELAKSVEPLSIDLRDAAKVYQWLDARKRGVVSFFTIVADNSDSDATGHKE